MRTLFLAPLLALLAQEPTLKFEASSRLVIVNVTVKDRDGKAIEKLRKEDFVLLEDGKPQPVSIFELQRIENTPEITEPIPTGPATPPNAVREITPSSPGQIRYRDRRLLVLYFDLSSMPPEDQMRARSGALDFLAKKMTPADLVAVMTFSSTLKTLQDFTADRTLLDKAIRSIRLGDASELATEGATPTEEEDPATAFTADETEFNIFNTDRKLSALQTAVSMFSSLPEKKAFVYFSSGASKTGVENQAQLRSTVAAAVKSNVSFYPVDTRGLVAEAPLGNASQGGGNRGTSVFSGEAQRQRRDRFADQQETLFTLAADTGGKALLDNNDLSIGITNAQRDFASYYILGYYATNNAEDGKFRKISIRVPSEPRAKLEYRPGYYASKKFQQFSSADRERQLEEALLLGNPITDLPVALEANFFRRAPDRYVVPVALKIPGAEVELARKRDVDTARLDFIGSVRDARGTTVGSVRDFIEIKLRGATAEEWKKRSLQYDTAFTLPAGDYTLKFLVRENETGKMGTFESPLRIPVLDNEKSYLAISSVVWANQREPLKAAVGEAKQSKKLLESNPLVKDGTKLIPSITKVFRKDQRLRVFLEAYPVAKADAPLPQLAATVSFFRRDQKVFESSALRVTAAEKNPAVPLELDLPLNTLPAGRYLCQLNVIDETGRKFAFRRTPLVIVP